MNKLGLALSGGGFRATLFHLGVLRYLRDVGALTHVTDVASVSGGSILAAHAVLNWDKYTGGAEEFDEAAADILRLVRFDVRNHIVRRLPLQAPLRWIAKLSRRRGRAFTPTAVLERYYRAFLFGDRCLYELPAHPRLHILTTNVSNGGLSVFNRDGLFIQQRGEGLGEWRHAADLMATLPHVVAASSAFPGFFPPVEMTAEDLGVRDGQFPTEFFTDGGVYDNLGLRAFAWLKEQGREFDHVLVSDAGKPFQVLNDGALGLISRSVRASDILWDRVWQLERENFGQHPDFTFIQITDRVDEASDPTALPFVVQAEVQSIRTDLDRFSDLEINALARHGYAVSRSVLETALPAAESEPTRSAPQAPWAPVAQRGAASALCSESGADARSDTGPSRATRAARKLRRSSRRRVWSTLLDLRDWPSYLYLAAALLLFVVLPWKVVSLWHRAQSQAQIIDAITRGNPDIRHVLNLVNTPPATDWPADFMVKRDAPSLSEYGETEVLTHNRVLDLRQAPLEGTSGDGPHWIDLYDHLTLKRANDAGSVRSLKIPFFMSEGEVAFRHEDTQVPFTITRVTKPVPWHGVERQLYELAYDVTEVPPTRSITAEVAMRTEAKSTCREAGFVIDFPTDLLNIWVLFPRDRPYKSFSVIRYPADHSAPSELVEARYTIDHPEGNLIGWSVVNPEVDYVYECRWTMP